MKNVTRLFVAVLFVVATACTSCSEKPREDKKQPGDSLSVQPSRDTSTVAGHGEDSLSTDK